ncbi:hypothetical protein F5Y04DRAFT_116313 [Hypomontagnella monticulosa]|nr:hypothetical protein F5Y04DRAFT_116313 [Hypomontagnella monticulosa]
MDRPTLQAPKTGRSRFSKALPAPPPGLDDDRPRTASRDPPPSLYSPFPPRKDSVSTRTTTTTTASPSIKSSLATSPLPALPSDDITMGATQLQTQTRSIPRKPVGLPANPAPSAAAKSKKMKRVSSISSLLSAYSHTSSDSVQRSSQGSIFTKDSEPSNSPEREGMNDAQQSLAKTLPVLPSNPYLDEVPSVTDDFLSSEDLLPPPPPLKDPTRPSTPSSARPSDPFPTSQFGAQDGSSAGSPTNLVGDSPQRREIWRRRASSKSDGTLLVPELKLAGSHGSTAATTQTANPDLLPPPPSSQTNNNNNNTTSPLPPRNASLPGRNIRPTKQAEPQQESEMRKLTSKLKDLTTRGDSAKDSEDSPIVIGMGDRFKQFGSNAQSEVGTDASAARPTTGQRSAETSTNAPKMSVETAMYAPSSAAPSEPPPKESAEKSISRRPVGNPTSLDQPEAQKRTSPSDLPKPNLQPGIPHSIGLPRFPRPSQSNPTLRSPSAPMAPPALQNIPESLRPRGPPQLTSPPAKPLTLPADSIEPMKKPELFNVVTSLNEPKVSPGADSNRKPTRKVSRDVDAAALSDIGESVEHMTPEQTERINQALSRFPRNLNPSIPPPDAVWQAAPITSRHYGCYVNHCKWVPVKNSSYALACQTCRVEDTSSRKTCSWCNLRICFKCQERLMGPYKADLRLLMENMDRDQLEDKRREKGKQTEGT